jgi:hypothetical protein
VGVIRRIYGEVLRVEMAGVRGVSGKGMGVGAVSGLRSSSVSVLKVAMVLGVGIYLR